MEVPPDVPGHERDLPAGDRPDHVLLHVGRMGPQEYKSLCDAAGAIHGLRGGIDDCLGRSLADGGA